MTICIAGKNEIAIDITLFIKEHFPDIKIVGLVNASDKGLNSNSRSFKWFLEFNKIKEVILEDIYLIPDLLFLSLEFDKLIDPSKFLTQKLFNVHFSYLPAYKGQFTSAWPILNSEEYSGVTLHEINQGIDTGDILDQVKFEIDPQENARTLYKKYLDKGAIIVKKNLKSIIENNFTRRAQPSLGSTFYSLKSIDYKNIKIRLNVTACQLDSQIRAFTFREYQIATVHGYKVNRVQITDKQSILKPGKIVSIDEEHLVVSTVDFDVVLFIDRFDEFINACVKNDLNTVKELLPLVNIEEKTNEGWTALIVACYNNAVDVAAYLLKEGADVNAKNYNGTNVLMYAKDAALRLNNYNILEVVLSYHPDIYCRDFFHKNVFDYLDNQSLEIAKFIKIKSND